MGGCQEAARRPSPSPEISQPDHPLHLQDPEYLRDLPIPPWINRPQPTWRRYIQNITPSWFAINMGTGVVSILLYNQPYQARWLHILAYIVFVLNIVLFVGIFVASILRYILYPELWRVMLRHPVQSMYIGTLPMGFATIINMIVFACVPHWGDWARTLAVSLWIVDAAVSICCCLLLPFIMMFKHPRSKPTDMTAVWLFPVLPNIVASATGAIVADALPNPQHAFWTMITCYVLWGMAVPMALAIIAIYFNRLITYKLPPRDVIVSVFLPCGPTGQGAFAIMKLGQVAHKVFPRTHALPAVAAAGDILYVFGFLAGLVLWAFGLVWLFFAFASVSRSRFPFNMGSWSCTFPIGVWVTATITIGKELPSTFFNVVGIIFSICVIIFWLAVSILSIQKAFTGDLFYAPCVAALECRATILEKSEESSA
ncbi:sulfite efflux pump SSU1 [Eremomyces bilateralis CBS 781.70]|uniref:Sulfite efflux pump SSU1 n=1 Tax=Eremomyces bilateralis CBS 781.70 TaxID=1392243 RepID=A0A6G1GCM6_9PEZI|nr:sulfite efflux pump SSU1 [Eremomyces bilateralis CBS 781.70]KAF1815752.1 sulfite efflux pump SSU1 [Eremomyces bilateralis CBS 781.70]